MKTGKKFKSPMITKFNSNIGKRIGYNQVIREVIVYITVHQNKNSPKKL